MKINEKLVKNQKKCCFLLIFRYKNNNLLIFAYFFKYFLSQKIEKITKK